ncbi:MAG TPA: flagellar filament capping protein FliD, partial [Burkholderiales bacterium]|nr:flagellar filament capping protein FliD [Burkholderiales bacterium]
KAYNDLEKTLADLSAYDSSTRKAAVLQGDSSLLAVQWRVHGVLTTALAGLDSNLTSLWQVGVTIQADGTMKLDSSKLQNAISSNFADIAGLFAATGKTTDSLVNYVGATSSTKPGGYALNVTTLATQGKLVGSAAAALTISAGVNDTLLLHIDGIDGTIRIPAGTYTASSLAAQLQSSINGTSAYSSAGISVTASQSAGVLTITSNRYGSASALTATGGTALVDLLGATQTSTAGVDVAGTINGVAAAGSGQTLTGAAGTDAAGLQAKIGGGTTGARGSIYHSQGYAYQLSALASAILDDNGSLAARTNGINQSIKDIDDQRTAFERHMTEVEARYRAQFTALDTMMSSMTQTSNYLQQQLTSLQNLSKG